MDIHMINCIIQIIHKSDRVNGLNKEKKKIIINRILKDLEQAGIFNDIEVNREEDRLFEIEMQADIEFGENEGLPLFKQVYPVKEDISINERIKKKQIELGTYNKKEKEQKIKVDYSISYGRTPLHEAISLRDIKLIRCYLKEGKFLIERDNNGHTAYEMAFYERYEEAIELFKKYKKIT